MGAVDTPEGGGSRRKGSGLRRPKHRISIRIDMTPMVDVAFLLLIFFMVTTVFRQPQAMEINLPPKDQSVKVAQSHVIVLRVNSQGNIFWNMVTDMEAPPTPVTMHDVGKLLRDHLAQDPDLITIIKVNRDAQYHYMVDLMDELALSNVERFSLAPMTPRDIKDIESLAPGASL
jgi:biopolymer transport protein ExbD